MVVRVTLNEPLGADLGPFLLESDEGTVTPATGSRAALLAGLDVTVDNGSTEIRISSILPSLCSNELTIPITGIPLVIIANNDTAGPINGELGGDAGINVLSNDTLNGITATTSSVTITSTPTGPLTVNSDGTVDIAPNTAAGTYTIGYTICEIANPTNCDTATVTVTVEVNVQIEVAAVLLLPEGTDCNIGDPSEVFANIVYIESNFGGFVENIDNELVLSNSNIFAQPDTPIYDWLNPPAGTTITISPKSVVNSVPTITPGQGNINGSYLVQAESLNNPIGTRLVAGFITTDNIVFNPCS